VRFKSRVKREGVIDGDRGGDKLTGHNSLQTACLGLVHIVCDKVADK